MADQVVVWSPEALEDVDAIAAYIARDSVFYAAAVVEKMLMAAANLNHFPEAGRIVPELNQPDIRERFVYSYRLIYRVELERILVTAVIHGKRLLDDEAANRIAVK
jgi:plasmid stabilization system protein ParE